MKSTPRNDTHLKIAAALVGQTMTAGQIIVAIGHASRSGVCSSLEAMRRHREVVKLMPVGKGHPHRWRLLG